MTGASSGLGDRFARVLHANGAIVVACARRLDRLEALAAECDGVVAVKCDVTVEEDRQALMEAALAVNGRLDLLVNNAGVSLEDGQPATTISQQMWMEMMNVNLNSVL